MFAADSLDSRGFMEVYRICRKQTWLGRCSIGSKLISSLGDTGAHHSQQQQYTNVPVMQGFFKAVAMHSVTRHTYIGIHSSENQRRDLKEKSYTSCASARLSLSISTAYSKPSSFCHHMCTASSRESDLATRAVANASHDRRTSKCICDLERDTRRNNVPTAATSNTNNISSLEVTG